MAWPRHRAVVTHLRRYSSLSETPLERSIRAAIQTQNYTQIPHLLVANSSSDPKPPNPFSFLTLLPPPLAFQTLSALLRSFVPLRPRSLAQPSLSFLLSLLLPNPNPNPNPNLLPLALLVLQSTLRLGLPVPSSTRPALSLSWLRLLRHRRSPAGVLSSFDLTTANYLLSALCAASAIDAAVEVLGWMPSVGIEPDCESYSIVIEAMGSDGEGLLREMMVEKGMVPRRKTVARVVRRLSAAGEARRAAELVKLLGREGMSVGFEAYEAVVEGCLENREVVLAARAVAEMASRGFIPSTGVRRKVVEGLVTIGQVDLAFQVRRRLAGIGC